ncbi:MAG: class I SAM-dependent methyltransferase [Planctomycetota bacterium]|nr:class I SAM-dependent methyltransferase [Planctomycetota bacterium]
MENTSNDPELLRSTILKTIDARTTHRGEMVLPCIPAALEYYVQKAGDFFRELGKPLSLPELDELRSLLEKSLNDGFRSAGNNHLVLSYETSATPFLAKNLACSVALKPTPEAGKYEHWRQTREDGTLFGTHPDARVVSLVESLVDPCDAPILDIGAGNGRNAIPLAQRRHPVDAIEMTPRFVEQLQGAAKGGSLPLRVMEGDFFAPATLLPEHYYQMIVLAEVVSDFRGWDQLRQLLVRANQCLRAGGLLVFNVFLSDANYEPDDLVRQMAEVAWACLFTPAELHQSMVGLPLQIIADDSVVLFEKQHLPPQAWPPTPWFESWASGRSIFPLSYGRPPVEMRWIVMRKQAEY